MDVLISNQDELAVPISNEEIAAVVEEVLRADGVTRSCRVSVSIVDADEIRGLNAAWRDIDAPTDVLSFECDDIDDDMIPAGEPVELGDVILCPAVIEQQAPQFDTTFEEEFRLMLVHGACHLLGFDHIDPEEARAMEARELEILQELARKRGDDPNRVAIGPTTSHQEDASSC
ncbi:rRNA maturation RNase YbeY [Collinsella sp. D33t1_170424_A12]|uniref:rRNA maturation RNase YbeY n=1 Tax=Collinsella sp. D33t1_170424_A12 TaxID=2787135 RepID=UPI001897D2C2|nr:rRNA maturation RNase YbeY [Collinsella sp. D33t1_170424_A12]